MKALNKRTFLFLVLLVSITVNSQVSDTTYVVSFERAQKSKPCFGQLIPLKVVEDYSFLKNIPNIACDIWAVNSFKMNQNVKSDSIPNQMYLFIGVNEKKKEKYVVVDANNNHDFSDDSLYTFSLPDEPLSRDEKAERAVALQITPDPNKRDTVNIGIDPFNYFDFNYGQDKRLSVIIVFTEYMQAQAQIDGKPVEIVADNSGNLFQRDLSERLSCTIYYNDNANKQTYKKFYPFRDTIHINDKLYKVTKVEHPNMYIKDIGVLAADSSYVDSFLPAVYARDINNNKPVSINSLIKGKYAFIDFWGSWCGPCIQSIPELKDFYKKIKDRPDAIMLSVAKESVERDIVKLKNTINSNDMGWINLWTTGKETNITTPINDKLNINGYPTYLIIDNTGKIVYKESNMKNTQVAIAYFLYLIK